MFGSIFNTNRDTELKYEPVEPTNHDFNHKTQQGGNHSFFKIFFSIALVLFSVIQITLISHALSLLRTFSLQHSAYQVSNCSCGATMQEARTLDCTFDVLSLSWLPPLCRDAALTHEFATSGPGPNGEWDYWAHANGTSPLTLDEVASLAGREDGIVYTSLGFHILHCSFYWRKQWRAAKGMGAPALEARYDRESHVNHCQRVFMMEGSREKGMTESLVRLGGEFF